LIRISRPVEKIAGGKRGGKKPIFLNTSQAANATQELPKGERTREGGKRSLRVLNNLEPRTEKRRNGVAHENHRFGSLPEESEDLSTTTGRNARRGKEQRGERE